VVNQIPPCLKCGTGFLVPLSDYGEQGSSVAYKAWACVNPKCGFSVRVDKGAVTYGQRIKEGDR
jgi:hypothetical protein